MSQLSKYLRIAIVALEDAEMECTVDGMKPQKAYEQVHRQIVDLLANLNLIRDKIVSEIEKNNIMYLNQQLWNALKRKCGDVLVANHGIQNKWSITIREGIVHRELRVSGEHYRINCPFCNDTKHRCYVNYEFGVADRNGNPNLYLIKCFNEECFTYNPCKRDIVFFEVLYGRPITRLSLKPCIIRQQGAYVSPGTSIPIHRLDPAHPAITYLINRGFDPKVLGSLYKVRWCSQSEMRYTQSRIIIPVIEDGVERGWLARLAQDGSFTDSSGRKIPKYYNMPGFQAQKHLFNFDQAKHYKTIILVEGAFDAIKVGSPAVAILGRSISHSNLERLTSFAIRNDVLIVVALDPDIPVTDRTAKHQIEVAVNKLKRQHVKVMPFYLPSGSDPATLERLIFKRLLYQAAEQNGIQLDFSRI